MGEGMRLHKNECWNDYVKMEIKMRLLTA